MRKNLQPASKDKSEVKRVHLVDDHHLVRMGLRRLLEPEGYEIAGESSSARDAFSRLQNEESSIVIIDIAMPERSGVDLLKDLIAVAPTLRVIIFSMLDRRVYENRVLDAGAMAYIEKGDPPEWMLEALEQVSRGKGWRAETSKSSDRLPDKTPSVDLSRLSDRQLEIFRLVGGGIDRGQMASRLNLSIKTVDNHLENIRQRLGLENLKELKYIAIQNARVQ